jgi:GntR family transcriptional repressor for pyruvate dehydrogenase complex
MGWFINNEHIKKARISDIILDRISNMILAGTYQSGERLPPERVLAEKLNTSRPSVRAALSKLESQGMITRVQGGGTYVSDKVETSFSDPLLALFQKDEEFKYDVLEYRHALEEASCFLAAEKATDEEKLNIKAKFDAWKASHAALESPELEAEADLAFHLSIAEATHNYILPHAMKSSHRMIEQSVTSNLKTLYTAPERRQKIVEQHTAMLEAILRSDADAAREAVRDHLNFVRSEIEKADIQNQRESRMHKNKAMFSEK